MKTSALFALSIVLLFGFVVCAPTENTTPAENVSEENTTPLEENNNLREAGPCIHPGKRDWDYCGNPCFCSEDLVFLCEDLPCPFDNYSDSLY